jgi:RNA polymerase sigma-70 factor (ECF subfamily)
MIKELPAGYRTVFNMYAIDGYAHKEIAEQLGITESTSKSQLNRARAYLKKMLLELEKVTEQKLGNDETSTR